MNGFRACVWFDLLWTTHQAASHNFLMIVVMVVVMMMMMNDHRNRHGNSHWYLLHNMHHMVMVLISVQKTDLKDWIAEGLQPNYHARSSKHAFFRICIIMEYLSRPTLVFRTQKENRTSDTLLIIGCLSSSKHQGHPSHHDVFAKNDLLKT